MLITLSSRGYKRDVSLFYYSSMLRVQWLAIYLSFLCFTEQNRTNRADSVRLVRVSSAIELTEKFQFDYVRLPNQSQINRADWVRLSSIDF